MAARALLLFALVTAAPAVLAQVQDDFADGDFTADPPWQGDADRFTVVPFGPDFALRSDGLAESDTIALATASDAAFGRWAFTFRYEANLTNSNGTRVYLVADTPDLRSAVQGYYVQIGTNNTDEVRLYRQDGLPPDRVEIGASDGPVVPGTEGTVFVEVTRSDLGDWEVRVDGVPVIPSVNDDTYTVSAALGVWLKHSSANGAAFFWDDITAQPEADTQAPFLVDAEALSATEVEVRFNEPVLGCDDDQYSFDGGIGPPAGIECPGDGTRYVLLLAGPLTGPQTYTVTATDIEDLAGNSTLATSASFFFGGFDTPAPGDLVINEVMYDPPNAASNEYVELLNRTDDQTFDLGALTLSDNTSTPVPVTDQPTALGPGDYAVLVRDAEAFEFQFPGVDFIAVTGFPALNNGGDAPTVRFGDTVIDAVPYLPSWGGTDASLERRDPAGPSTSAANFGTSTDPRGGTPGDENSIFEIDTTPPTPLGAEVSGDGQTVTVFFDEPLDAGTVVPGSFSLGGGAPAVAEAVYVDTTFAAVLTLAAPLDPGDYTVTVTGVGDLAGNATDGATVEITFDPDLTPPDLAEVRALDATTVSVVFTEPVDPISAGAVTNYAIDDGIGQPTSAVVAPEGDPARVVLTLGTPLAGPQAYTLTASGIADLAGNVLTEGTATFFFGEGDVPAARNLVVNEIMYDPPDVASDEYVELFNRTADQTFDLSEFTLSDEGTTVPIADAPLFLLPGAYAALVRDAAAFQLQFPGVPFAEVAGFPGLNNGGDAVVLTYAPSGLVVDSVRYDPAWGGRDASLERRSADGPSNVASNYATSVDERGGTPAAPNSVPPDTAPPAPLDAFVSGSGLTVTVLFDEPLDQATVTPGAFAIDNGAPAVAEAVYLGDEEAAVALTLAAPLAAGDYTLTATGVADLLGNAAAGATVAFSFEPDRTPPALLLVSAVSANLVDVQFSEPVTEASAGDAQRYALDNGIGAPTLVEYAPEGDRSRVRLAFTTPLAEGTRYTLTVTGIEDLAGNVLETASVSFFFGEGEVPSAREIVVNEVQFQSPQGNDGEYVELFNRSGKNFDLSQFTLSDASSAPASLVAAPLFLLPDQYVVLAADVEVFGAAFPNAGPVLGVEDFPNLNSGGDAVVLRYAPTGATVDSVQYEPGWGTSDEAALERIDPAGPSSSAFNWASSTAEGGGTPGAENSVFASDTGGPALLFAEQVGETTVRVTLTEPLDPATVQADDFALAGGTRPDSVSVSGDAPTVDLSFLGGVRGGTLTVGAVADFVGNPGGETTVTLARLAPAGGLVVNEIMFDPLRDSRDSRLDGTEYVELLNTTGLTLALTQVRITDAQDENGAVRAIEAGGRLTGAVPFASLPPGGYAVVFADTSVFGDRFASPPSQGALADSSLLARFYSAADFSEVLLLPVDRTTLSLTNSEDTIRLLRGDGVLADSVAYSDDWHRPELADATGVALERISPEGPSSNAGNWTSSLDPSGGTPGRPNSVFLLPGEVPAAPGLTISPSPFNAAVGTQISYTLEADAALVRVRIFDGAGRLVRTLEDAALGGSTGGTLTWQGRGDDGRQLRIGIYVVFLEALDLQGGRTEAYKEVVVLARDL
ncbi:MAG: lamin tail domain-containing protein [Bacteroidota bacterium]